MFVIIDEVSVVGSNMLLEIHKRLQQIKGVSDDKVFGGVSILAVSVTAGWPISTVKHCE